LIEHLTQNQVEAYCLQQLRAAELLSVSDHLGECEACRRRADNASNGNKAFFALRSEVFLEAPEISSAQPLWIHPTVEETAGFVDGRLAGETLQLVTDHLTRCEQCALTVDELRAFKQQIAPTLNYEYQPSAVSIPSEGWWQRMTASLPSVFQRSPGMAFGAAFVVLLLAVGSWLVWQTVREGTPKEELVVSPPPAPPPTLTPPIEAAPVRVVAQLNDGEGQLTLNQEGQLSGADHLPPAYQKLLKEALANRRIEPSPQLKGLTRPPSSLMSSEKQGSESFVIEPVGKVLMTARPTFSWSRLDGATSYVVEVYDEKFNLSTSSGPLTTNSWMVKEPLRRGAVYSWQVKATRNGEELTSPRPPAPQAKFRVLDQAKANEIAKAKRVFASSHLTLGLLYADAGLLREAEQEFRLLRRANPNSEIARNLLRQIQSQRSN